MLRQLTGLGLEWAGSATGYPGGPSSDDGPPCGIEQQTFSSEKAGASLVTGRGTNRTWTESNRLIELGHKVNGAVGWNPGSEQVPNGLGCTSEERLYARESWERSRACQVGRPPRWRSADAAAPAPHMPCAPGPGGVAAEHRNTPGRPVA